MCAKLGISGDPNKAGTHSHVRPNVKSSVLFITKPRSPMSFNLKVIYTDETSCNTSTLPTLAFTISFYHTNSKVNSV